ncbi:GNAT family N-acetyltransferase [Maritalea sp.]|uniref:GNAT family N-acetyltransferase n=1 Tax=Maritalea sp. TaxID=2003361 RepID=UPI003EF66AE4
MIETERLILRPFKDSDLDPFASFVADPEVMRFYPATKSKDEAKRWINNCNQKRIENGFHMVAVERKSDQVFLGLAGCGHFTFDAPGNSNVETGWLFGRQYWGFGYAYEAAKASIANIFKEFKVPEIVAFTYRNNWPSRNMMEKLGMRYNPLNDFDHPNLSWDSKVLPHVLYSIKKPR